MARIAPSTFHGPWYDIDIVSEDFVEGQLILRLDEDSIRVTNRRHPGYWWAMAKAIWHLGKEAIIRRVKSN